MIVAAEQTKFAVAAGEAGLDHHAIAHGVIFDAGAHRNHLARRLMPQHLRKSRGNFAHAAVQIPVQIAAANSHRARAHDHFSVPRIA